MRPWLVTDAPAYKAVRCAKPVSDKATADIGIHAVVRIGFNMLEIIVRQIRENGGTWQCAGIRHRGLDSKVNRPPCYLRSNPEGLLPITLSLTRRMRATCLGAISLGY